MSLQEDLNKEEKELLINFLGQITVKAADANSIMAMQKIQSIMAKINNENKETDNK